MSPADRFQNLAGRRFDRLLVLRYAGKSSPSHGPPRPLWLCRCDCGAERVVVAGHLRSGHTRSCGCRQTIHGGTDTPEHLAWSDIKARCCNPGHASYPDYGGRGITVCDRWRNSFPAFLEDVGPRPSPSHSVGRVNNDRGYEPGNVTWQTATEQMNNRRNSRRLTFRGETLTLSQWAARLGVSRSRIQNRLDRGWTVEEAFTLPSATRGPRPRVAHQNQRGY